MSVTLTLSENGSIRIDGDIILKDHAGNTIETTAGKAVFLCRCGHSANKPFCDNAHRKSGFIGTNPPAAV